MRKIFFLLAALLSFTAGHADSYYVDPTSYEGKVVMIKAVIYSDTTSTNWKTNESNKTEIYFYNGEKMLFPITNATAAQDSFAKDPYRFYWVISKAPSSAESQYYFLSALKGDAYVGAVSAKNLVSSKWSGVSIHSTDTCNNEFQILSFDKAGTVSPTPYSVVGTSMRFTCGTDGTRWLAVSEKGVVNWLNYTTNIFTKDNVKWTTNLEFTEVEYTSTANETGSLAAPKHYGFPVKLTRSDDSYTAQTGEDYNYYATLKLPYAVELPSDVTAYKLTEKTNKTNAVLQLEKLENNTSSTLDGTTKNVLPREAPVLLSMTGSKGATDVSKTIYLKPEKAQTFVETGFTGSLRKVTFPDSVYAGMTDTLTYYILTKKGGRVAFRPMSDKTLNANKAYYQWRPTSSDAKPATALSFIFADDDDSQTTSLSRITTSDAADDAPYYDLTGRQVKRPTQPGIYIRNNRKMNVR